MYLYTMKDALLQELYRSYYHSSKSNARAYSIVYFSIWRFVPTDWRVRFEFAIASRPYTCTTYIYLRISKSDFKIILFSQNK